MRTYWSSKWKQIYFVLILIIVILMAMVTRISDIKAVFDFPTITTKKGLGASRVDQTSIGNSSPIHLQTPSPRATSDTSPKTTGADPFKSESDNAVTLNKANDVFKKRFEDRTVLKEKVCNTSKYKKLFYQMKTLNNRRIRLASQITVCFIPKVGTSYLQYLNKNVLKLFARDVHKGQPKTMILVREPYSRLLSGYIGKIVTNPPWQRGFGAKIIRKFRPLSTETSKTCGHDVTFSEHLKYIIYSEETGWMRNAHFTPIYRQCEPCKSHFDFIGHLETLKDDLSYALNSVNISTNMDFSDEEFTMRTKAEAIVDEKENILKCESMCSALSKVWWSFHVRGLIASEIAFPLKGEEECKNVTQTEFSDLAWNAHLQSTGRINKSKQRREALVNAYVQVPLADRLKIQEVLRADFELYGYDPQPDDIFPELKRSSES